MNIDLLDPKTAQAAGQLLEIGLEYGLDFLTALFILVAGFVLAAWVQRAVRRSLDRATAFSDETLKRLITSVVKYVILAFVLVLVLAQFGVQTASIIAVLGAAGLAIGLALQGTLTNIASGFMLLLLRPINVGDFIDADGVGGTVDEIGLFVSYLTTYDGLYVCAPNSKIWNATIINYSRNPTRRLDVTVGIAYQDDIDKGIKVLKDLIEADERVLDDPAPIVITHALADSSVNLQIRAWAKREDFWALKWDTQRAAKLAIEKAGITIPFPQQDLYVKEVPRALTKKSA